MRKMLILCVAALMAGSGFAALDTVLLYHDAFLPAQAVAAEMDDDAIVPSATFTTNAVWGAGVAKSGYKGIGIVTLVQAGNADAAYTNVAVIAQGPDAATLTNVIATVAHGENTLKTTAVEVDFDALTQAYWGVTFTAETDNAAAYSVSANVVSLKTPDGVTTNTGSYVDTINYKGTGCIVVSLGAGIQGSTSYTGTVYIQSAATSGGEYANVAGKTATITGTDSGAVTVIPWEFGKGNRYLRAVFTTENDVGPVSATIHSFK